MTKSETCRKTHCFLDLSTFSKDQQKHPLELVLLPCSACLLKAGYRAMQAGTFGWGDDGWRASGHTLAIVNPEPWRFNWSKASQWFSAWNCDSDVFFLDILTYGSWPLTGFAWKRPVKWENPNTPCMEKFFAIGYRWKIMKVESVLKMVQYLFLVKDLHSHIDLSNKVHGSVQSVASEIRSNMQYEGLPFVGHRCCDPKRWDWCEMESAVVKGNYDKYARCL